MTENWKPVVGYEGLYEISDLGNVRSLPRIVPGELRPRPGVNMRPRIDTAGAGYRYTNLSKNGKAKKCNVHVLVLEAFVGPRPSVDAHAMHLDGSRDNPALSNLRWGTQAENAQDKVRHGTHSRGEKSSVARLTAELVQWIRESSQSSLPLSPILGVSSSTIRAVRIGQNWTYA